MARQGRDAASRRVERLRQQIVRWRSNMPLKVQPSIEEGPPP
jgi:hypothetical protein